MQMANHDTSCAIAGSILNRDSDTRLARQRGIAWCETGSHGMGYVRYGHERAWDCPPTMARCLLFEPRIALSLLSLATSVAGLDERICSCFWFFRLQSPELGDSSPC